MESFHRQMLLHTTAATAPQQQQQQEMQRIQSSSRCCRNQKQQQQQQMRVAASAECLIHSVVQLGMPKTGQFWFMAGWEGGTQTSDGWLGWSTRHANIDGGGWGPEAVEELGQT